MKYLFIESNDDKVSIYEEEFNNLYVDEDFVAITSALTDIDPRKLTNWDYDTFVELYEDETNFRENNPEEELTLFTAAKFLQNLVERKGCYVRSIYNLDEERVIWSFN